MIKKLETLKWHLEKLLKEEPTLPDGGYHISINKDYIKALLLAIPPCITADEIVDKYFDNYLGYDWPSTDIRFVKIFYKNNKFYITDDYVNTQEVSVEWVKSTCELFFISEVK